MSDEAEALDSLLRRATEDRHKLTKDDRSQIQGIYEDLELEMAQYGQVFANQAPKGDPMYKVVVNLRGDDAKRIEGLRVYYTVHGVYRDPPVSPPVTSYP